MQPEFTIAPTIYQTRLMHQHLTNCTYVIVLSFSIGSSNLNEQSGHKSESSSRMHRAASSARSFNDFLGRFELSSSLLLFLEPLGLPLFLGALSPILTAFSGASNSLTASENKAGPFLLVFCSCQWGAKRRV